MKCTSKRRYLCIVLSLCMLLTGCSSEALIKEYSVSERENFWGEDGETKTLTGMAQDLCVVTDNVLSDGIEELKGGAGLFELETGKTLYAYNVHEKRYPASLTKLMTALLFLENYDGDYTDTVKASKAVKIDEPGAQVCGYQKGDKIPMEQLFYGLLLYSGNDAANLIAEYVGGSVDEFVNMMNQRAVELGATNTHFMNPHGLNDEKHYSTAYDLYLIFQEVMKYDMFRQVINSKNYDGEYIDKDGDFYKVSWKSTNQYFSGDRTIPENVTIVGGKTGTTNAAGACLILLSKNAEGKEYVSVLLQEETKDNLYEDMSNLLGIINKK